MIVTAASRLQFLTKLQRVSPVDLTSRLESTGAAGQKGGGLLTERQNPDTFGGTLFSLGEGFTYTRPAANPQKEMTAAFRTSDAIQSELILNGLPTAKSAAPATAAATSPVAATAPATAVTPATAPIVTAPAVNRDNAQASDPVSILKAALEKAGISSAGMRFSYADDFVTYPGGGYANRQVTVELPNGRRESYSADLMLRNPQVTVVEIQRLMNPK